MTPESALASAAAAPGGRRLHPAVLALGLRIANGSVAGGTGRAGALLDALRSLIADYSTPPGRVLARDLAADINAAVAFLVECRPLSAAMGAAIKFVKLRVSRSDPALPLAEAKQALLDTLDAYVAEKITFALAALADRAAAYIADGDVVLTYSHSAAVLAALTAAKARGVAFRVVVVDGRPDLAGRAAVDALLTAGIPTTYVLLTALAYILPEATKVVLGAAAVLANGVVVGRAGGGAVAHAADAAGLPVLVCAETHKFVDRVALDAITANELRDPGALAELPQARGASAEAPLANGVWATTPNLTLLNLAYDACPAECVTMVVTELGAIPPSSVPVVLREFRQDGAGV